METRGEFEVKSTVDKAWNTLCDAKEFSKSLPGVKSAEVDADRFVIKFVIDIRKYTGKFLGASYLSNMNTKFEGEIKDKIQNKHVAIDGTGSAMGMKFSVSLNADIYKSQSGTKIAWRADISAGGLARVFGESTMEAAVSDTVNQIITNIKNRLNE
jgi:carbon monoxide dehydrogenase subunit G